MKVRNLLANPPLLHNDYAGHPISWQLESDVLEFLSKNVKSTSKTLETGAGLSTLLFAVLESNHTCIVPDRKQIIRIKSYCKKNKISLRKVRFINEISEVALPKIKDSKFDLVLIDGRHAFPTPFIDWYYVTPKLKIGGQVIIDDTQLWTGKVLKNFLLSEHEWILKLNLSRSAVFTKKKEGSHSKEWTAQPFVVNSSTMGMRKEQLVQFIKLLKKRKMKELISKVIRQIL